MAILATAVAVAGYVLVEAGRLADREARNDSALLANRSAIAVAAEIDRQVDEAARGVSAAEPNARIDDARASSAARVLARDSGLPAVDGSSGLIVLPRYRLGTTPSTTQLRREALVGYSLEPLRLDEVLAELAPTDARVFVDAPDRQVAASAAPAVEPTVRATATFPVAEGVVWSVSAALPEKGLTGAAWWTALVLVLAGGATAAVVGSRRRASAERRAELAAVHHADAMVARLALLTQETRELAQLLPALATELATDLRLRGLVIITPSTGGERRLFGWGEPPVGEDSVLDREHVAAGESAWLRLSRSGRTAGRLGVVADAELDRHALRTLTGAADLVASAVANAEAFAQQEALVERMRAVDELKSVFLATASHELRTPVVAIAGYSRFLHENWERLPAEKALDLAERVDRNARRLQQMVEDLLDFSRLERGTISNETAVPFDLGEAVGHSLSQNSQLTEEHELSIDLAPGVIVRGSQQAVERIVTNLVGNAAKYSPPGTRIRVLVAEGEGRAELVVEDDGPGIPVADRERIFSRFYRGRGDEVTRTRGTGLGLAIVSEFAASMGGRAGLEESDGEGARFVVAFPTDDRRLRTSASAEDLPTAARSGDPS